MSKDAPSRALLWSRRWEHARRYYAPWHERIENELRFALKMQHYLSDPGWTLDRRRIRYKGRELFSKIRRIVADVTAAPIYIEAVPTETDLMSSDDPLTAEDAKWALEQDIRNADKGFEVYLERMVLGAVSARAWGMAVDFEPDIAPFGEVLFRNVDPTKLFRTPGYQDLWDPRLPWVIEEVQMRLVDVKRMKGWNTDGLVADNAPPRDESGHADRDAAGQPVLSSSPEPEPNSNDEGMVTILKCWSRFDDTVKVKEGPPRPLDDHEQYAGCTECGWRSEPGVPFPPEGTFCEQCLSRGQVTFAPRIVAEREDEDVLARRKGKRLEIIAPLQSKPIFDGDWPQDMRGFPYMELTRYEHPRDPIGLSDTTIDSPMQIINNALMQRAYDQVRSAPNIIAVTGHPKDDKGSEFTPTDEPWQVAYFEDPNTQLNHFKTDAVSPSLVNLVNLVQQSFRADIGTAEIGLGPEQSKDIAVGTVERIVESGSVPTDHLIRRLRRVLAPFMGVISDIQRNAWSDERWIKIQGPDGLMRAKRLRGAGIPNADFTIKADPSHKVMSQDRIKSLMAWYQMPPALRDEMAQDFGIDPNRVQRIVQKEQQLMQQQMMMQPPPVPGMGGQVNGAPAMPAPGIPGVPMMAQ